MREDVFYAQIPTEALHPAAEELAARLRVPIGYRDAEIDALEKELKEVLQVGMCAARMPILKNENGYIELPAFSVKSTALSKSLADCREVYLMAVTLGMRAERWLHRLSVLSPAKHFAADALASAYAEAAAEYANRALAVDHALTRRFSPGYGDLPLSIQPQMIFATNANKYLHISVNESLLMIPQKSITAIIGIRSEAGKGESI
ncbi:MAG: hypothetical protein J6K14_09480 [Clostridia bacterium]|nr:hypothetical protein [Clostridia bacterium]